MSSSPRASIDLWYRDGDDAKLARIIRAGQISDMCRRLPVAATTSILCAGLLAFATWGAYPRHAVLAWLIAIVLSNTVGLYHRHRVKQTQGMNDGTVIGYMWAHVAATTMRGAIWGLVMIQFDAGTLDTANIIGLLFCIGIAAGGAVALAGVPQAAFFYVIACLVPGSVSLLIQGNAASVSLAIAALLLTAYLIQMSYSNYRMMVDLIWTGAEHERLGQELKATKDLADAAHKEIKEDLVAARRAQMRVMPTPDKLAAIHRKSGTRVEAHFEPCMHLGGDHWSIICPEPHIVRFCVSDVAGHGVTAALNSFKLVALLARMTEAFMRPKERAEKLNEDLARVMETGQYATVLLAELNTEEARLSYVGCGGPAPMLIDARREVIVELDTRGLPMGISASARYEERSLNIYAAQLILIFSDAMVEAQGDDGNPLGREWIKDVAMGHIRAHGQAGVVDALVREFRERSESRLEDDLTVIAIWYDPADGTEADRADR